MQNLHTLSLRGFHGHVLELQLSTLPNLRTLKLHNIEIRNYNQPGFNGITKLANTHTQPLRGTLTVFSEFSTFPNLRTYRSSILPPDTSQTTHHINVYLSKLRASADTLTKLELVLLGRWTFNSKSTYTFTKTFKALTTLRLPSTKLVHLTTLTPNFGVGPSTIQRIEVVVHSDFAGHLFTHLFNDIVSHAVAHLKPHFPNLAMVKLTLADPAPKGWCGHIQLFLAMMDHVASMGVFMKHKVGRGDSGSRGLGCIDLDNGLVIDSFELMRHMARHDVDWVWPTRT